MVANRYLKLPNLHVHKTKQSISSQKLGSWTFGELPISVLKKVKSAILPLFSDPEVFSSASDKAKLFDKNSSKNSNLDDRYLFNCFPF